MGTINSKRIGAFADFCKQKKHSKTINENSQVAIDVPFWDDAINTVLDDLRTVYGGGNPINWDNLVKNIKIKFGVLDIFDKDIYNQEEYIVANIKDILYFRYGDSILEGDTGVTYSTAEMGAKSLVLSQLANAILDKVRIEAGIVPEPKPEDTKPVASVCLDNYYCYEDDDFCGERHCAGFGVFTSMLKESVNKICLEHDEKALDYCLKEIERVCGSLKLDDILSFLKKEEFSTLGDYVSSVVAEYLNDAKIELDGVILKNTGDDKNVLKQAKKLFANTIIEKVMDRITKENLLKK